MAIRRRLKKAGKTAHSALTRVRQAGRTLRNNLSRIRAARGLTRILASVERGVKAGQRVEHPWEIFRLQVFPGHEHMDAATELGLWAGERGIEIDFNVLEIEAGGRRIDVIYVRFSLMPR